MRSEGFMLLSGGLGGGPCLRRVVARGRERPQWFAGRGWLRRGEGRRMKGERGGERRGEERPVRRGTKRSGSH